MGNVVARHERGPLTFEVDSHVVGGKLVTPSTGGKVKQVAAAGASVLGVALYDALPEGTSNETTTSYGATAVDFSVPQPELAVAFQGVFKLKNSGSSALALGGAVEASASGDVAKPAVDSTHAVIGQCVEPGGIAAGATGLVRLSL